MNATTIDQRTVTSVVTPAPINALIEPFRKDMTVSTHTIDQSPNPSVTSDQHQSGFSTISDQSLFSLCQQYGKNAKMWKRKFEELLPEVLKRRLYKKHNCVSIYEFAAKLCGLSRDSVDNVIRVYDQLEDKPTLQSLVVEFGWSKLRIVAGVATHETDASWAEKVRVLPKNSLETFVRDLKRQEERKRIEAGQDENKIIATLKSTEQDKLTDQRSLLCHQSSVRPVFPGENLIDTPGVACFGQSGLVTMPDIHFGQPNLTIMPGEYCENSWTTMSFRISPETEFRLRKLKARIEKGRKEKISFNQLFGTMLDIAENKEKIIRKTSRPGIAPLVTIPSKAK